MSACGIDSIVIVFNYNVLLTTMILFNGGLLDGLKCT